MNEPQVVTPFVRRRDLVEQVSQLNRERSDSMERALWAARFCPLSGAPERSVVMFIALAQLYLSCRRVSASYNEIAADTGLSKRAVIKAVAALERNEFLIVDRSSSPGDGNKKNTYRICDPHEAVKDVVRSYSERAESERASG